DPIHKVTIIPRGRALGITQQLPIDERHTYSKEYLLDNITILLGGRVAEELVLNHMTTGAGNDIERATAIVRKMVCEWGMSEKLGPLNYGKNEEHIFLGREIGRNRDFSEDTAQEIDQELRKIITDCYNRAKGIIVNNMDTLHALANALLEKESLDGLEIDKIIGEINNEAGDSALQ
nr:cell division protein FtsH [Syntrophorhabdaceae bacterium]